MEPSHVTERGARASTFSVPVRLVALLLCTSLLGGGSGSSTTGAGIEFRGTNTGIENQGILRLVFKRYPSDSPSFLSAGRTNLDYTIESGTAVNGVDFVATSGTIAWGKGHTGNRVLDVELIDDFEVEGSEEFLIHFTSSGEPIQFENPLVVKIMDDDGVVAPVEGGMTLTYVLEIGEDDELRLVRLGVEVDAQQAIGNTPLRNAANGN